MTNDSRASEQKNARFGNIDENPEVHVGHLASMGAFYARTAAKYNSWHCNPSDSSSHNFAVREVLQLMRETDSRTALDVCCGTGRAVKALLDEGYDATGIDFSPEMLAVGVRESGIPEERMKQGDATALPFPDQSFDVTCVLGALHHTARPTQLISEMLRVSRKGIVVSDELNRLSGGLKQILISAGIFAPVYRLLFRREPRQHRRMSTSDEDGPTYVFTAEEIIPLLKSEFDDFKCLTFYSFGHKQICSYHLPRLFAKHGVISVKTKKNKASNVSS